MKVREKSVLGLKGQSRPDVIYCSIIKEMSSLYLGLDLIRRFKAIVPEFDVVYTVLPQLFSISGRKVAFPVRKTQALNRQNTSSTKYCTTTTSHLQYLIFGLTKYWIMFKGQ
jgi:hypothetical protein